MSNPLYQMMGQNSQNGFLAQFNEFKKNFSGDPQQQIQNLLNSGKVSQQQYNAAVQKAQAFAKMFNLM